MTKEERRAQFEAYRKEHLKRVPLDMRIEDYERMKMHAQMAGIPVNRYIKEAVEARMAAEDKKLGIKNGTAFRVNEKGEVEFYMRFPTK